MKVYDKAYFDKWYRSSASVIDAEFRRQKVRLAVAAAEYVLGRRIRSVLDIGCGEGAWRADLRRMRRDIYYLGIDSSEYVVERYGKARNIRLGNLGTLSRMKVTREFDLVVCSDVLEYVPNAEVKRGLKAMLRFMRGVAYIEAYTNPQEFVGDLEGWHLRSESLYRRMFAEAGLYACGLNCYVKKAQLPLVGPLERCG